MDKLLGRFYKYWLFPVVWMSLIFFFSSMPTTKTTNVYWSDFVIKKTAHVVEYMILSFSLYRALRTKLDSKRAALYVLLFCVFYAITDEIHQSFTPGREPTVRDVIFDTIGASLAIYLSWTHLPKAPSRLQTWAKKLELI